MTAGHGAIVLGFGGKEPEGVEADHGAIVLLNLPESWNREDVLTVLRWCDQKQARDRERDDAFRRELRDAS